MQGVRMIETGLVRKKPLSARNEYYLNTATNICNISPLEQQILNTLPTATYICDPEGTILFFNEAAVKLWGRRPETGVEILCGSWKVLSSNGSVIEAQNHPLAIAIREHKEISGQELIIKREDGSCRTVICQPKLFFDESGNLVGALNMMNDITDWLETEKARRGTMLDDDFLASIPFSLRDLLKEVMILMQAKVREKKITLELDYDNRLKNNFVGDVHRIKEIMINLVGNAVKFTSRGSVKIIVGHSSDNNYLSEVAIHVVDSGIGIAEHRKNAIFQSPGSSGLTRSQTLARLMGGEINAESREHSGSEFTLLLPLTIDNNIEPAENHQLSET